MKKNRFAALLAAAVLCVSALTACSQNGGQTSNPSSTPNPDSSAPTQTEALADLLTQIQERGEIGGGHGQGTVGALDLP